MSGNGHYEVSFLSVESGSRFPSRNTASVAKLRHDRRERQTTHRRRFRRPLLLRPCPHCRAQEQPPPTTYRPEQGSQFAPCQRSTATSTYAGSISIARQERPVISAAMMVVPDPQNGS